MTPPRVFISYSHDSRAHCDAVLALAQQLRCDGIAAELDQFHQEELLHWPRWCEERMRPECTDFVLCVCTEEYARRVEGRVPADVGKGVFWEGTLIYNELYDAKGNPRCVPVLLGDGREADIPRILRNWTWLQLKAFDLADAESGYAKLWRLLMRRPSITAEAVGEWSMLPSLPEEDRQTDFVSLIEQLERKSRHRYWILSAITFVTFVSVVMGFWQERDEIQNLWQQGQTQIKMLQDIRVLLAEIIITSNRQQASVREPLTPQQRYDLALQEVAFKHDLRPDELRAAIDAWTHKVNANPEASFYDKALAEYKANRFDQAAAQAGKAYEQAMQARTQATQDAIKAARLEGDAYEAEGHYDLALAAYRKSADLTDRTKEPLAWADGQNMVAKALWLLAHYTEAESILRDILTVYEQQLGQNHPDTATALNNLAQLLINVGRFAEAEPLIRQALAIEEKIYGPEDPNITISLNNLAELLRETNRLAEAEPLYRRALAIDEKKYGPEHYKVGIDLNNLALLLQQPERLEEAEPLAKRVVGIFEKAYGPDHPRVAIALNNLATLKYLMKQLPEAEPLLRRALSIDEKNYEPGHPNIAIRLNNLARLLHAMDRLADAEPLSRQAVVSFLKLTRTTGHEHPNLRKALDNYWGILQAKSLPEAEIQTYFSEAAQKAGYSTKEWEALVTQLLGS